MKWLTAQAPPHAVSTGVLLLRLVVGAAFVLHGLPKFHNPTGWMDGMSTAPPGFLQATGAVIEVGGGLLLMAGLFHRVAAALLACQMLAALLLVHVPHADPFVAVGRPSAELACVYLSAAVLLTVTGPGEWSLDAILFERGSVAVRGPAPAPVL